TRGRARLARGGRRRAEVSVPGNRRRQRLPPQHLIPTAPRQHDLFAPGIDPPLVGGPTPHSVVARAGLGPVPGFATKHPAAGAEARELVPHSRLVPGRRVAREHSSLPQVLDAALVEALDLAFLLVELPDLVLAPLIAEGVDVADVPAIDAVDRGAGDLERRS